jgi:hypothetical protein
VKARDDDPTFACIEMVVVVAVDVLLNCIGFPYCALVVFSATETSRPTAKGTRMRYELKGAFVAAKNRDPD